MSKTKLTPNQADMVRKMRGGCSDFRKTNSHIGVYTFCKGRGHINTATANALINKGMVTQQNGVYRLSDEGKNVEI